MATVLSDEYSTGHKVILKNNLPKITLNKIGFLKNKILFLYKEKTKEKINFIILDNKPLKELFDITLYYIENNNKIFISIYSTKNKINSFFNHYKNNKSCTHILTNLKEDITIEVFKKPNITENNLKEILNNLNNRYLEFYKNEFYLSSLKQYNKVKDLINTTDYYIEKPTNSVLYNNTNNLSYNITQKAISLYKVLKDNWNPADIWMFRKDYIDNILNTHNIHNEINNIKDIKVLNSYIKEKIQQKIILPISLKHILKDNICKLEYIDSNLTNKKHKNYNITSIDFSSSFRNFIIYTKEDYAIRCGFKASSTTIKVSLEGRYISKKCQVGAISAKEYPKFIEKEYNYILRNSNIVNNNLLDISIKELKELEELEELNLYPKGYNENNIKELYNKDKLTQNRFINIVSYLYSIMKFDINKTINYTYNSAKKISENSCSYYLLS